MPADAALLPYWIGAAAISLLSPLVEPAMAARLPFALLLVLSLVMTWYSTYHLARTDAAQPLPSPSAARPIRSTMRARWPTAHCSH